MHRSTEKPDACKGCGFHYQCICDQVPHLSSSVEIVLLVHRNELTRETNTGKIVSATLSNSRTFTWDRVTPPAPLIELISDRNYSPYLLFPGAESQPLTPDTLKGKSVTPVFIILDSTWQEARKMVRRSPWLQALPTISLSTERDSEYTLRRNQDEGNLCTCEAVIELLQVAGEKENTDNLERFFHHYLSVFKADKSGHALGD